MPDSPPLDPATLPPVPSLWPPTGEDPEFVYMLEEFRFYGSLTEFRIGAAAYLTAARLRGWTRLLLASTVTGNPKSRVQLWRIPFPYPGKDDDFSDEGPNEVERLRRYRHFFERIDRLERTVMRALPYDPGTYRPDVNLPDTMLLVRAHVRDGAMARLARLKQDFFKPTVESERFNWKLHFAGYVDSATSAGSSIVQFWKLPDANALGKAMSVMGHHPTYLDYVAPCIAEEKQEIYSVISDAP
jgi:hypothetical protein